MEVTMFARLRRLFRAWVGFFISKAEDPEIMLQDAIEEMRTTMPRLNAVLVATRATVIRIQEERDVLAQQDRNLTGSIQAALRDGSAAARAVAEEDALQLQQIRTELQATEEQLAAAKSAHDSATVSVEALKTKLKAKIEACQKALKERQKASVMKSAADAIVELQSYGVAATADKFLEQIKQEVAESKAAVEVATGSLDTAAIERERTSRKLKAASILQQFEVEMGIAKPQPIAEGQGAPTVGPRTAEKQGS
jgi:phage shock protein A